MTISYQFRAKLWQHQAEGRCHFVSLPEEISIEIRTHHQQFEEGWGRLNAKVELNEYAWETAIWYDTKRTTYLLPIKAAIRKKNILKIDELLDLKIKI